MSDHEWYRRYWGHALGVAQLFRVPPSEQLDLPYWLLERAWELVDEDQVYRRRMMEKYGEE